MSALKAENSLGSLGNYQLLEEIGRGNFGTVYRARHWETGRPVAVKIIPGHLARNPTLLKRFRQEGIVTSRIHHPNVVHVLEYCFQQDQPFLVMELVEGQSLGERMEREGKLTEAELIPLMVQACQGLDQIHSLGLLHRDVKPDNLLVTPAGQLKVIDLGLAKDLDTGIDMTRAGTGLGTPNFIPPEQFRNAKSVDRRCDVYGLGASLYQLVTGTLPFAAANPVDILTLKLNDQLVPPQKLVPWLGERTVRTIQTSLHINPRQRFRSCWEFAESLVDTSVGLGEDFERLSANKDFWYVLHRDRSGKTVRSAGTTAQLISALQLGRLGNVADVRLARTLAGPFRPMAQYAELLEALTSAGVPVDLAMPRRSAADFPLVAPPESDTGHLAEGLPDLPETTEPDSTATTAAATTPTPASTTAPTPWWPTALFLTLTAAATAAAFYLLFGFPGLH